MSIECNRAFKNPFPAPPGVYFPQSNELNRRNARDFCKFADGAPNNPPLRLLDQMKSNIENVKSANWAVFRLLMLLGVGFILARNRRRLWRLLHHQYRFLKTPSQKLRDSRPNNPLIHSSPASLMSEARRYFLNLLRQNSL